MPENSINTPTRQAHSKAEIAQAYGLSRRTIDNEIQSGRLRVIRVGRRVIIPLDAEREWLAALSGEAA